MKAKALSQFYTKLRYNDDKATLVSIGQVIEGDDDNLRSLARNRMVELVEDSGEPTAKPAQAKAAAKPGAAAKPAKGKQVEGKTVSAPLAGTGEGVLLPAEGVLLPAPEGTETLPPVQSALEGEEGSK